MLEYKRKIEEITAIYLLEEDLVDIYVEGPTDKFIIENYIEYKNVNKNVVEIDTVDFLEIQNQYVDLNLRSNKDKLVALSRILAENPVSEKIKCIVDRDFDGVLTEIESGKHLIHTDFNCIESYILCRRHIQKILKLGFSNFPHSPELIIQEISKVLLGLFKMRLINKKFNLTFAFPRIDAKMGVNKTEGTCSFSFDEYLNTYINVNMLRDKREEINFFIIEVSKKLDSDIRFTMNGHDFIEVLFYYMNKIKNTANFRLENFEKAIYLSIQPDFLENYNLFINILK